MKPRRTEISGAVSNVTQITARPLNDQVTQNEPLGAFRAMPFVYRKTAPQKARCGAGGIGCGHPSLR